MNPLHRRYDRLLELSEKDLTFVVETVATRRRDHDRIRDLVRDKPDLVDIMLDDEKLFARVISDDEIFLKISPYLLFTILLRHARKQLKEKNYTLETVAYKKKIPVFDGPEVSRLLDDAGLHDYLVDLLSSFTRTTSTTLYFRVGERIYRRKFSDLKLEDMVRLSEVIEESSKFPVFKRIGDISLFITGMFPENALPEGEAGAHEGIPGFPERGRLSFEEYNEAGRKYYHLAAGCYEAAALGLEEILHTLAEKFSLARKPLNLISDQYIRWYGNR